MMKLISMTSSSTGILLLFMIIFVWGSGDNVAEAANYYRCSNSSRCSGKTVACPYECPDTYSRDPNAKVCFVNCQSPHCSSHCRRRKPDCNGPGAACYDPRLIGGDGIVFYFHGKSNQHFSLVSDRNLQINAQFTGHRPSGRSRDFTWIKALGLLFASDRSFSVEATKAATWDDAADHLRFTYNGDDVVIPEGPLGAWSAPDESVRVERIASRNSALVTVQDVVEISVNVVPVTKEDDRIHNYRVPSDDCFAHLQVQFRFHGLSDKVSGVLGRTYRPDFENPAKPGVAMPVVGGEDDYRTTSLFSSDCRLCVFNNNGVAEDGDSHRPLVGYNVLDCTHQASSGNGIVCRK